MSQLSPKPRTRFSDSTAPQVATIMNDPHRTTTVILKMIEGAMHIGSELRQSGSPTAVIVAWPGLWASYIPQAPRITRWFGTRLTTF